MCVLHPEILEIKCARAKKQHKSQKFTRASVAKNDMISWELLAGKMIDHSQYINLFRCWPFLGCKCIWMIKIIAIHQLLWEAFENLKMQRKYTNPARGILDFCQQKFYWPLLCSSWTLYFMYAPCYEVTIMHNTPEILRNKRRTLRNKRRTLRNKWRTFRNTPRLVRNTPRTLQNTEITDWRKNSVLTRRMRTRNKYKS